MEFWIVAIPLYLIYAAYGFYKEKQEEKEIVKHISILEQEIMKLREINKKLTMVDNGIKPEVIVYREKYESDKQRKIYYAAKSKTRPRRY